MIHLKKRVLKLKSLKDALQISMETLRRDVQQLVKDDLITKEYGGIRLKHVSNGESIIEQRLDLNIDKKCNCFKGNCRNF